MTAAVGDAMLIFSDNDSLPSLLETVPADSATLVVIHISRAEVESQVTGSAVDRLLHFSDSAEFTRRFANSLILEFAGYDEDPRPLFKIPEVVRFFRALTVTWPFWTHFIEKETDAVGVVLGLLVDTNELCGVDPDQLGRVLRRLLDAMNRLYHEHGIGAKENIEMTNAFFASLDRVMMRR